MLSPLGCPVVVGAWHGATLCRATVPHRVTPCLPLQPVLTQQELFLGLGNPKEAPHGALVSWVASAALPVAAPCLPSRTAPGAGTLPAGTARPLLSTPTP